MSSPSTGQIEFLGLNFGIIRPITHLRVLLLFEVVYGWQPITIVHYQRGETMIESTAQSLVDRDDLRQLKFNLQKA